MMMPRNEAEGSEEADRSGCWMRVKIVLACIGVFMGMIAFFLFTFLYGEMGGILYMSNLNYICF